MNDIKVGQIWITTTDGLYGNIREVEECENCGNRKSVTNRIRLGKGEYFEIRYPYEWHFRTEENKYMHAEPDVILNNAKLFGIINEDVRLGNSHRLIKILKNKLYSSISTNQ